MRKNYKPLTLNIDQNLVIRKLTKNSNTKFKKLKLIPHVIFPIYKLHFILRCIKNKFRSNNKMNVKIETPRHNCSIASTYSFTYMQFRAGGLNVSINWGN